MFGSVASALMTDIVSEFWMVCEVGGDFHKTYLVLRMCFTTNMDLYPLGTVHLQTFHPAQTQNLIIVGSLDIPCTSLTTAWPFSPAVISMQILVLPV